MPAQSPPIPSVPCVVSCPSLHAHLGCPPVRPGPCLAAPGKRRSPSRAPKSPHSSMSQRTALLRLGPCLPATALQVCKSGYTRGTLASTAPRRTPCPAMLGLGGQSQPISNERGHVHQVHCQGAWSPTWCTWAGAGWICPSLRPGAGPASPAEAPEPCPSVMALLPGSQESSFSPREGERVTMETLLGQLSLKRVGGREAERLGVREKKREQREPERQEEEQEIGTDVGAWGARVLQTRRPAPLLLPTLASRVESGRIPDPDRRYQAPTHTQRSQQPCPTPPRPSVSL